MAEDRWREFDLSGGSNDRYSAAGAYALTLVLPVYRKVRVFSAVLAKNARYLSAAHIEVVLMLDEPSELAELAALISHYPAINWRLFYNSRVHGWRNPAPVINQGVRRAAAPWVLVCSPESEFCGDVPESFLGRNRQFEKTYGKTPRAFYGTVKFLSFDEPADLARDWLYYGSIFFAKSDWQQAGGYPEHRTSWGFEDDTFRHRLIESGVQLVSCTEILLLHREPHDDLQRRLDKMFNQAHFRSVWEKQVRARREWLDDYFAGLDAENGGDA